MVNKKVQYTQEQAHLKREQMAAAAEARMAALKLASQQQTLWSDPRSALITKCIIAGLKGNGFQGLKEN